MLKKVALFGAAACFAMSTTALAASGGMYVGASLGYQSLKTKINTTTTTINTGITDTDTSSGSLAGDGANGALFVGYGLCLGNNFWAGLELNGELSSTKSQTNDSDVQTVPGVGTISDVTTSSHKLKGAYGISFRPGYFLTKNAKVYGVLGWERGKFENTYSETVTSTVAGVASGTTSHSSTKWRNGFRYGFGTEINLTNQLGLRAEFTQTNYKKSAVVNGVSFKNRSDEASVGLVWTIGDVMNLGSLA